MKKSSKKPAAKGAETAKWENKSAGKPIMPKISRKTPPKRKNVSQKIPNGRTLQTRDEHFEGQKNYRKPGYENKGDYRRVVVIDSNRDDELAVIKLTTSKKEHRLNPINRENHVIVLMSKQRTKKETQSRWVKNLR